MRAPNTKRMQESIHISMAVKPKEMIEFEVFLSTVPSALGVLVVTVLKMLTRTRKIVTSKAILPGMTSGGTTKLIQETTTNRPEPQR